MNLKHLVPLCLLLAPCLVRAQDSTAITTEAHRDWPYTPPIPNTNFGAHTLRCTDHIVPAFDPVVPGSGGYQNRICNEVDLFSSTPGFSLGNPSPSLANGWQIFVGSKVDARIYGAGIKVPQASTIFCLGVGDCNEDHEMISLGARTAPSDEGAEGSRRAVMEPGYTYSGTITSPGTIGDRLIRTACPPVKPSTSTRCDAQGVGRYLIEEAVVYSGAAVTASKAGGIGPSPVTVRPGLPQAMLSTAWGILTSPCVVTQTAANTGTSCDFTVKVMAGEFRTNSLVAASGTYHNQAQLTGVQGSGSTRRLTMVAHHAIPQGASIYQGQPYGSAAPSCTGTALELLANTVETLKYPVDVIGCVADPSGDTILEVAQFLGGNNNGMDMGNVVLGTVGVLANLTSDATGNVTLVPAGDPIRYIGQTVTIAHSQMFSGVCENVQFTDAGRAITCHQPGAPNRRDAAHDAVAISLGTTGAGNSALVLHRMAEVLDVRNPETLEVDGSFTLEANEMNTARGTEVEESHHYSQSLQIHADMLEFRNPYQSQFNAGIWTQLHGGAYFGTASWISVNGTRLTDYAGFGGTRVPPNLIDARGIWNTGLYMDFAPAPVGAALEFVGCPATAAGCADTAYRWRPRRFAGDQGDFTEEWNPATDSYRMQTVSTHGASVFEMTPTGFAFDKPLRIASGVAATDAAAVGQLPLAASFTSGDGASDVLSLPGMTPAGHCSMTATNPAAARNLTLTYIAARTTGSITIAHLAVPGMTYDVLCTSY